MTDHDDTLAALADGWAAEQDAADADMARLVFERDYIGAWR